MAEEPVESIRQKTCIIRASIHCEGCKRKVKKILSQVHGVEYVDVDAKQHKVTVTGNVDGDTLIKKLIKSGKNAELWPQKSQKLEKIPGNGKKKEREIETHGEVDGTEASPASDNGKPVEASTKVKTGAPVKAGDGSGEGDAKPVSGHSVKTSGDVQEKKSEEEKKSDVSCSAAPESKEAVGKSNSSGGGDGGGNGGESGKKKKKKKKGQNGNPAASAYGGGLENREPGPPPSTNESPPCNHYFPPPLTATNESPPRNHHFPPQPAYAVSYNTVYPTSSYTASYYSAPPPHAYAYMHPGREIQPPPLDPEFNPRQPLDSFEIFSDENPNGCFIM